VHYLTVSANFSLENHENSTGNTNKVRNIAADNPPTITMARGFGISAPTPVDNNMGIKPRSGGLSKLSYIPVAL